MISRSRSIYYDWSGKRTRRLRIAKAIVIMMLIAAALTSIALTLPLR